MNTLLLASALLVSLPPQTYEAYQVTEVYTCFGGNTPACVISVDNGDMSIFKGDPVEVGDYVFKKCIDESTTTCYYTGTYTTDVEPHGISN